MPVVEQGGLVICKEAEAGTAAHYYDRFRGRLMFPIADEQGRVIGFSGRVLAGDEKTAKYVNSPETPLFIKGRVMFGLDKSKRACWTPDTRSSAKANSTDRLLHGGRAERRRPARNGAHGGSLPDFEALRARGGVVLRFG